MSNVNNRSRIQAWTHILMLCFRLRNLLLLTTFCIFQRCRALLWFLWSRQRPSFISDTQPYRTTMRLRHTTYRNICIPRAFTAIVAEILRIISHYKTKDNTISLPFNHVRTLFFNGQVWVDFDGIVLLFQSYDAGLQVIRQYRCLLQGTLQTSSHSNWHD